jgi:hypothetical protein
MPEELEVAEALCLMSRIPPRMCKKQRRSRKFEVQKSPIVLLRNTNPHHLSYHQAYYALNWYHERQADILRKLNSGETKQPKKESIVKYNLIQHANGAWSTWEYK